MFESHMVTSLDWTSFDFRFEDFLSNLPFNQIKINKLKLNSNPGRAPLSVPDLKKISILDLSSSLFVSVF